MAWQNTVIHFQIKYYWGLVHSFLSLISFSFSFRGLITVLNTVPDVSMYLFILFIQYKYL